MDRNALLQELAERVIILDDHHSGSDVVIAELARQAREALAAPKLPQDEQ